MSALDNMKKIESILIRPSVVYDHDYGNLMY